MTETNSLSQTGRLAGRGAKWGRCRNDIYCVQANESGALRIKRDQRFVCPECFKPLQEVPDPAWHLTSWRNACLMIGGGLAVTACYLLVARPVVLARHTVSVFVVMPEARNPATTQSIAIPVQTAEIPLTPRKLASQQIMAYRKLAPMSHAVAFINPVPRQPTPITSPHTLSSSLQNRDFSAAPVAGGEPAFPESAESQGVLGLVRVTCRIETNGTPANCEANAVRGGHSFSNAILLWLKSKPVRFAPILRHGQPVAEVHSWDIEFSPDL